jgi:hypothetical protein
MLAVTSRFKYPAGRRAVGWGGGHASLCLPCWLHEGAARHTYCSHGSEIGTRAGLATGLPAALGGDSAFSVDRAGFGLTAGAVVAGARTIGFAGVAASGALATAATAGFGPAVSAAFVGAADLRAGAAIADAGALGAVAATGSGAFPYVVAGFGLIAGATVIGSGAVVREFPPGDGPAVRTGVAPMAGLVRGSGDGRGTGTVSGNIAFTRGARSSTMIALVAS